MPNLNVWDIRQDNDGYTDAHYDEKPQRAKHPQVKGEDVEDFITKKEM